MESAPIHLYNSVQPTCMNYSKSHTHKTTYCMDEHTAINYILIIGVLLAYIIQYCLKSYAHQNIWTTRAEHVQCPQEETVRWNCMVHSKTGKTGDIDLLSLFSLFFLSPLIPLVFVSFSDFTTFQETKMLTNFQDLFPLPSSKCECSTRSTGP